jgi:hypothetical protein
MRLLAAVIFAPLVVSCAVFAQAPTAGPTAPGPTDLRKAAWGMTQAQVMATESNPPRQVRESNAETIVQYDSVKLGDLECTLVYTFAQDKLLRAIYTIDAEHGNLNDFIADYRAVEPLLIEKHGKPASERALWLNDLYQDEPKSYLDQDRPTPSSILPSDKNVGLSVSAGHLKLFTHWETGRTKVLHALSGENGRITHQIEYARQESSEPAR